MVSILILYPEGPAVQLIPGIGCFLEFNPAEASIGISDCCLFACGDGHLLLNICVIGPVVLVAVMDFHNVIFTRQQLPGGCIAVGSGGDGLYQFLVGIQDLEAPVLCTAVDCILLDTKVTVMVIREGHSGSCIGSNLDGLYGRIHDPVRIRHRKFLCIQSLRHQIIDRNRTIGSCSKGRTGNGFGTGRIRIDPDLPSAQITVCVRILDDLHRTGFPGILKAHRCGTAISDGHFLGILAGTAVHSFNGRIRMTQFLDIVSSDLQTGYGNLAAGIRRMRSGNQCGAGGIGIDPKAPAGQICTAIRRLCQTEITGSDLIGEAHGCCTSQGDGHLLGIGTGADILGIDAGIAMTDFLDIISTRCHGGHSNLAICVGGMRTGHQFTAGRVRVNTELPA